MLEKKILWDYPCESLGLNIWQTIFLKFDEKENREIQAIDQELA